jgi:hypothetical protein
MFKFIIDNEEEFLLEEEFEGNLQASYYQQNDVAKDFVQWHLKVSHQDIPERGEHNAS